MTFKYLIIVSCVFVYSGQIGLASEPQVSFHDCFLGKAAFRIIYKRNAIVLKIVDNTISDLYLTASLNNSKKRKKVLLPDLQGKITPIGSDMHKTRNVDQFFSLPSGFNIKDIASFAIFSRGKNIQMCELAPLVPASNPYPIILQPLQGRNGLKSKQVTILSPKIIEVKGLNFKALAPGAYFYVGSQGETGNIVKLVDDQTGQVQPLKRAKNKHFTLRLPDGLDVTDFDEFGIWSTGINRSLSHIDMKAPENAVIGHDEGSIRQAHGANSRKCIRRKRRSLRTPASNDDMPNFEHFPKKQGFGKESVEERTNLPISSSAEEMEILPKESQKPWVDLKKRQDLSQETQDSEPAALLDTDDDIDDVEEVVLDDVGEDDDDDDDEEEEEEEEDCYEPKSSTTEKQLVSLELLKYTKPFSLKNDPSPLPNSFVIQPSSQAPNRHALADKSFYNMEPFEEIKPTTEQEPAWQKYWQLNQTANHSTIEENLAIQKDQMQVKKGSTSSTPKPDVNMVGHFEKAKLISKLKERLKNRKSEVIPFETANYPPFKSKTRKNPFPNNFQDPMKKAEKYMTLKNKLIAGRRTRPFSLEKKDRYSPPQDKTPNFRSYLSDLLSPLKRLFQSALGYPSNPPARQAPQVKRKLYLPWDQTRLPRRSQRRRNPPFAPTLSRSQIQPLRPESHPNPISTPAYVGKNMLQSHMLAIHHQNKRKTNDEFMEENSRNENHPNVFVTQDKVGTLQSSRGQNITPKKTTTTTITPKNGPAQGSEPESSSLDEFRPIMPLIDGSALPALAFNVLDSSKG